VVIVIPLPPEEVQDHSAYTDAEPYTSTSTYYAAAAWDESAIYSDQVPPVFTVGKGDSDTTVATPPGAAAPLTYINVPLSSGTAYSIFVEYDIANENPGSTEVRF
jgi:hypothetical protein